MPSKMSPEYQREYRKRRKAQGRPIPRGGQENPEKQAATKRLYVARPEVRARLAQKASERRLHEAEKYEARQAVRNALLRGDLLRLPCEECGNPKAEAHHEDYIKQLVVRWLCRLHHRLVHALAKGEK